MKSIKFLLLIFLGLYALGVPHLMALKEVPFPSSSSLQPIPTGVYPNISGNVNHKTINNNPYQNSNTSALDSSNTSTAEEKNNFSSNIPLWFFASLSVLSILFATILLIKRRDNTNSKLEG